MALYFEHAFNRQEKPVSIGFHFVNKKKDFTPKTYFGRTKKRRLRAKKVACGDSVGLKQKLKTVYHYKKKQCIETRKKRLRR